MRHSYLRIEEVDEGESKRKMKTINNNKNIPKILTIVRSLWSRIVKWSVTYFEWFSIGGHYDEFRNTAIQSFGCFIGT